MNASLSAEESLEQTDANIKRSCCQCTKIGKTRPALTRINYCNTDSGTG